MSKVVDMDNKELPPQEFNPQEGFNNMVAILHNSTELLLETCAKNPHLAQASTVFIDGKQYRLGSAVHKIEQMLEKIAVTANGTNK